MTARSRYNPRTSPDAEHSAEKRATMVRQVNQDECALHIMTRAAADVLEHGEHADPFSVDVVNSFFAAIDDGTAVDILIHVSEKRSRVMRALMSQIALRTVGFQRAPRRSRTRA